jgi:hypothetical protein
LEYTHTRTAKLYLDKNDILHVKFFYGVVVDHEDALDNYLVVKHITGGAPVAKLIDQTSRSSVTKKALKVAQVKEICQTTIARAYLFRFALHAYFGNLYYKLTRPEVPTKCFNDYRKAYDWLMERKTNYGLGFPKA